MSEEAPSRGRSTGTGDSALVVEGLRKTFHRGAPTERVALDGLSLRLGRGEFAVVIGGNGAGKSTFLNALAGEIALDDGRIRLAGQDVTALPTHRRARQIARVFQDPMVGTAAAMTIEENLSVAERRGVANRLVAGLNGDRRRRYRALLEPFGLGLETQLTQKVDLLSGGQRQALSLVMAIMKAPDLLLLDEHCAALDPRTAAIVMAATVRAVRDHGLTTLMVTHNMRHAIEHGDRLLMLSAGRLVLDSAGEDKRALTVEALVERFGVVDDRMLLVG